jgi:nitroimidazol reductase NimA-like FMN-containing flavoprotein (pyridoxamine 5'-phosphate oxidase superfamily)
MECMSIREMSEQECRTVLGRARIGRLGCAKDNQPYVVPVSIVFEEGFLYSFATQGQKVEWMRENPKVCVQVDELTSQSNWVSVIASGAYQELREPQFEMERAHARKVLDRQHQWWMNALAERQLKVGDELIAALFYRIRVAAVSGLAMTEGGTEG